MTFNPEEYERYEEKKYCYFGAATLQSGYSCFRPRLSGAGQKLSYYTYKIIEAYL